MRFGKPHKIEVSKQISKFVKNLKNESKITENSKSNLVLSYMELRIN